MPRFLKRMRSADNGYALVAALGAVLAFSLLGFEVMARSRGDIEVARAELERARLQSAADAGTAAAIASFKSGDGAARWAIDGTRKQMMFDGVTVGITIEDERGKVPINKLSEQQVHDMFELAGASGERLSTLVDSFEDWIDADNDKRPLGAEAADYARLGYKPRNGALRTLDELLQIHGMDEALYDKIKGALTVDFGESGGFSVETAQPFAIAVMTGAGMGSPQVIERERELAGQVPAKGFDEGVSLAGRRLTIRAQAVDGDNGQFVRLTMIEITGGKSGGYWVRNTTD